MKIEYTKKLQWANSEKTLIDLIIKFDHLDFEVPFTANPNDIEAHGRQIFTDCVAGKYGVIGDYIPPVKPKPTADQNKSKAIELLRDTDWVNQPDVTDQLIHPHLSNYNEFVSYRSHLRQIAVAPQEGDIEWPKKPTAAWSAK
jgi:hypothetical protein